MALLELVKLHDDGANLLLRAADGSEFELPICADLMAVVANSKAAQTIDVTQANRSVSLNEIGQEKITMRHSPIPATGSTTSGQTASEPSSTPLRPAEIQAQLRAGMSAEDIAADGNVELEKILRYESPVIAEREYVIATVRNHRVASFDDSATLGELADARLVARGVDPAEAEWACRREAGAPWLVEVKFAAGNEDRHARWTYDMRSHLLVPLDDEARWLGLPDDPLTPEVFSVSNIASRQFRREATGATTVVPSPASTGTPATTTAPDDGTAAILDDLAARRGRRRSATEPRPVGTVGTSAKPATVSNTAVTATAPETAKAPVVEINPATPKPATRSRKRAKSPRAAVPSWDEIMLGGPKREE